LEKNTDSLRDFIISLDKSKADKLRYKVEDRVVKIFITPYRTNLSANDLEFSQGDFNVDAVVALGVQEQQELDNAITAHGRILHDATVMSVNTSPSGGLGSINWHETQASSLCELVTDVGHELGKDQLDSQIATALLTGIVAETDRFSNDKTVPQTMSVSAELMSAGANQQLVASKLEGESVNLHAPEQQPAQEGQAAADNGTLEIGHKPNLPDTLPEPLQEGVEDTSDAEPMPEETASPAAANDSHLINADKASKLVTEPPQLGGTLTANSAPERADQEPVTDPLSLPAVSDEQPILKHDEPMMQSAPEPEKQADVEQPQGFTPAPPHWTPPAFAVGAPEPTTEDDATVTTPPEPEPEAPKAEETLPLETPQPEIPAPAPELQPTASPEPATAPEIPEAAPEPIADDKPSETLSELEQSVGAHQEESTDDQSKLAESARNSLADAYNSDANSPTAADVLVSQPPDVNAETAPVSVADAPQQPLPAEPPSLAFDPSAFGALNDPDSQQNAPTPLVIPGASTQPSMPAEEPQSPPPVPPPFAPPSEQK
jgi:hypothetical protein